MKKYLLYICAATLLISCNKAEVLPTTESGAMSFAAQLSNKEDDWSTHTRGAVTTNSTIASFSAFCFRTGSRMWSEVGATSVPNKMFNQRVERSGDNWVYTPEVMWSGGDGSRFTFFGYSPYSTGLYDPTSNPTGNNIEVVSTATTEGAPVITFAPLADVTSQVDLLVTKPVFDTHPVDYVTMNFTHALTQVRFKGWAEQPNTVVTGIAIKGVVGKATLNIGGIDNEWIAAAQTADYAYTITSPAAVSTDKTLMTDLSTDNNAFMLLPQNMTANTTAVVQFSYTIDGMSFTKEYVIKENWERNQSMVYTVNLTVADKPLGVTVEVTPWVIGTGGAGNAEGEVLPEEGSYIPNSVLLAAGWPADILPIEGGLQVAARGNVLPGGTPAAEDPKWSWKTTNSTTAGVESAAYSGVAKFGMGKSNTDAMTTPSEIDSHPAAKACRAMGPKWYLPSVAEFALINKNKSLLSAAYTFSTTYYWSSTQQSEATAHLINTGDNTASTGKNVAYGVRCVKGTPPPPAISVTPSSQADIPAAGGIYTIQLTSNYAWTANSTVSGVAVTPSSGAAGTNVSVEISIPANATTSKVSYPVVFTATGSGTTTTITWIGTQLASPPLFIEINGYKWANGNLVADGANGAKIGAPTDDGLYFKFGSLIGWSGGANGDGTGVGSSTLALKVKPTGYTGGTVWTDCGYYSASDVLPDTDDASTGIGDPCRLYLGSPWRLPTMAEFKALCNGYTGGSDVGSANAAWQNSPAGVNFNNNSTKLFIPASGYRSYGDGSFRGVGTNGYYWSESVYGASVGYYLGLYSSGVNPQGINYSLDGFPVRCVQ